MSLVLDRGGTQLDHIAIGVPDTRAGAAEIAELTGLEPVLDEPHPESFYWSGTLPMGDGKFLEILGPNPQFTSFNPFIEKVKRLERPQPLFWYVGTDDFEAFCEASKVAGGPIGYISEYSDTYKGSQLDYIRGIMGPGFLSVAPNVIQWRARDAKMTEGEGPEFRSLQLSHPEAERLNTVFDKLGIEQRVLQGEHRIALTVMTPKGEITFEGEGMELRGLGAMIAMTGSYFRWLLGGRK